MATRRAIANGNWSATATWNGGIVPTNGETVYASGWNITLDTDLLIGGANNPTVSAGSFVSGQWYEIDFVGTTSWTGIGAASNTTGTVFLATGVGSGTGTAKALATLTTAANASAGAAAGGSFVMSTVRAINTDLRAGTTTCLNVTATNGTLSLSGLRVVGGTATGAHGVNAVCGSDLSSCTFTAGTSVNNAFNYASTGSVSVNAFCIFVGGNNAHALNNASTGTINVSGSCTFTGGSANNGAALNNASTGTINVSGSCTFTGNGNSTFTLNNASTGTINVSGSCTFTGGSLGTGSALNNASTGSVTVTNSTFAASAFTNAVNIANTSADVCLSGDFLDHWSGWKAISGTKWRLGTAPTLGQTRYALAGTTGSYYTMYGADNGAFGNPIAADVRSGVVYAGGNLTGTCAVPSPSSTAFGVPVDNTTGTAVLTPAAIRAELATELGRIDASISSRLADADYVAPTTPPTAAEIATAVESSILNEGDGQAVLNAIVGAIGNSNVDEIALIAAIRSDLERTGGKLDSIPTTSAPSASTVAGAVRNELTTELSRIDQTISSRLASADYTAPTAAPTAAQNASAVRSELSVELARLDAPVSGVTAPSAATVASAVRSELSSELTKVSALNTERLANVATTQIVGTLLAQSQS